MVHFMSLVINLSILSLAFPSNTYSLTEFNSEDGFTTDLIHRDSSISPLYDSTASHEDLISKAVQRSKIRADRFGFGSFAAGISSPELIASDGDYLMKVNLGSPPVEINLGLDTGSAFSWTQCAPCDNCFPQTLPLFTPKASSTYKAMPGDPKQCKALGGRPFLIGDKTCRYSVNYWNESYSHGIISSDTLRLNSISGSPIEHKKFIFGCGYENMGTFKRDMTGIIGLGRGPGFLVTQMQSVIGGKFSYCLLSHKPNNSRSSKIHFGSRALVAGSGVVSTGLHYFQNTYAAKFKGLSVGKNKLAMIDTSLYNSSKILGFFNERIIDSWIHIVVPSQEIL
ncbi:PREDICTED: aspartic proteinase CDR1-like [Erythranthe guttata]|uniref:aspartic proteinase CDR1-like n=1 Tax=Erythranthe guttata TaxID=4155 RepID=UPI00064DFB04|nr:PREDICTED: aspartic proteinase CDR1-like [Erythranthe guttata]|eukprot:XP_012831344.1 PREDICTED: aspartic proteinase CDR1-like [Erythranthe guttata]